MSASAASQSQVADMGREILRDESIDPARARRAGQSVRGQEGRRHYFVAPYIHRSERFGYSQASRVSHAP
jgi:hypothetical protein